MRAGFSFAGIGLALARKVWVLYPLLTSFGLIFWPGKRPPLLDFEDEGEGIEREVPDDDDDNVVESWS